MYVRVYIHILVFKIQTAISTSISTQISEGVLEVKIGLSERHLNENEQQGSKAVLLMLMTVREGTDWSLVCSDTNAAKLF